MIYASDLQDMQEDIYNAVNGLEITKRGTIITITGHNLLPNTEYRLQLLRRSRKGTKTGRWIEVQESDGYRYLVDKENYTSAPSWMPRIMNNMRVTTNEQGLLSVQINTEYFFLPFIKPVAKDQTFLPEEIDSQTEIGLVGLNKHRPYRMLHFTFVLKLDNKTIRHSKNIIGINGLIPTEANPDPRQYFYVGAGEDDKRKLYGLRTVIY